MKQVSYIRCEERVNPKFYHSIGCGVPAPEQIFYVKSRLFIRHSGYTVRSAYNLAEERDIPEKFLIKRLEQLIKGEKILDTPTIIEKIKIGEIEEALIDKFISTYQNQIRQSNALYKNIEEKRKAALKLESEAQKIEWEQLKPVLKEINITSLIHQDLLFA